MTNGADLRLVSGKAVYDSEKQLLRIGDALLLDGGIIREIGRFDLLKQKYPYAELIDLSDCYLFPGLINTHVHFEFTAAADLRKIFPDETERVRLVRAVENARIMLRSGVTTVRDAGSSWGLLDILHIQNEGYIQLPRLQLAGPPLTITGGHLHFLGGESDTVDELIKAVRTRKKRGCGAIKIVVNGGQMTPGSLPERVSYTIEQIKAATDQAHHLGLPTFAHCLTTQGFINVIAGNVQSIEHAACFVRNHENGLLERKWEPEVMEKYQGDGRFFCNGLSAHYHRLDNVREGKSPATPQEEFWLLQEQNMCDIFKKLCKLGFVPTLGNDAGVTDTYFDETWLELAIMVERCGMTAAQAIEAATVNSAAALGLDRVTGRLSEGYAADIVALKNNPLEDIRAFSKVEQVICAGRPVGSCR